VALAGCASEAPTVPVSSAATPTNPSSSPSVSCSLALPPMTSPTPPTCDEILAAARRVGIPAGASVRVVAPPIGDTVRTAPDVALVVTTDPAGTTQLILVGYVGVDPELSAWVPDPALYPASYEKYAATFVPTPRPGSP
jgi:hypothetical protein